MLKTLLPFDKVPQLSKTDIAYATGDPRLRPFYRYEPKLESFSEIISEREKTAYPRAMLSEVLKEQYRPLPEHRQVTANIAALADKNTFTVATAHQPSLFLGPLYFLYKALTTINLAEAVEARNPGKRIVPVFVLGSEDHDLEELNSINLFGKKLVWPSEEKGAVGSMRTAGLTSVLAELKSTLGESEAASALFQRVERGYTHSATIAEATQAMLHDLFGRYGLVVLNMNDARLKRHFLPYLKVELKERPCFGIVTETSERLNALGFKTQATPREINLFYMLPGLRERIVLENGAYKVLNTDLAFSEKDILAEVESHPERFSPNVVLRPLYQEVILPNLAYVGGGGELAYWLERKPLFEHFGTAFPALVRRHSVMWLDRDAVKKLHKFGFTAAEFFGDTDALVRTYVEQHASGEVSLQAETSDLKNIFDRLAAKATAIDPTLEKAVRAEEVKAVGSLEQWENRLVRAEKQKHEVTINQIRTGKEKFFPGGGLQERHDNFMPYLLKYGDAFIETLKANLTSFDQGFVVLEEVA
ncbi:MAG: bacillithiol biosynthesis cysteine-adding enzyme BshC [Haliscomenobacteraceae bacterium CHB4]|nr:putative cysteine ligase BshC [Saprospiraceae bacterium]MCE7926207.1 bacillithiol biosynthesis cysteine-adding enzyme BshC [Haliscomenobacteraceae bacterium CHB4]